jgi:hypothetical protein
MTWQRGLPKAPPKFYGGGIDLQTITYVSWTKMGQNGRSKIVPPTFEMATGSSLVPS